MGKRYESKPGDSNSTHDSQRTSTVWEFSGVGNGWAEVCCISPRVLITEKMERSRGVRGGTNSDGLDCCCSGSRKAQVCATQPTNTAPREKNWAKVGQTRQTVHHGRHEQTADVVISLRLTRCYIHTPSKYEATQAVVWVMFLAMWW